MREGGETVSGDETSLSFAEFLERSESDPVVNPFAVTWCGEIVSCSVKCGETRLIRTYHYEGTCCRIKGVSPLVDEINSVRF